MADTADWWHLQNMTYTPAGVTGSIHTPYTVTSTSFNIGSDRYEAAVVSMLPDGNILVQGPAGLAFRIVIPKKLFKDLLDLLTAAQLAKLVGADTDDDPQLRLPTP